MGRPIRKAGRQLGCDSLCKLVCPHLTVPASGAYDNRHHTGLAADPAVEYPLSQCTLEAKHWLRQACLRWIPQVQSDNGFITEFRQLGTKRLQDLVAGHQAAADNVWCSKDDMTGIYSTPACLHRLNTRISNLQAGNTLPQFNPDTSLFEISGTGEWQHFTEWQPGNE